MASPVQPIPDGYGTVTPYLTLKDTAKAIEFYRRAFDAQVRMRMDGPGGVVMHAELQIGSSIVMVSEEDPRQGCRAPTPQQQSPVILFLYVPDADAAFARALRAGATVVMPVADMFWGDRHGQVVDPFGYRWSIATHTEDLTQEEIERRGKALLAKASPGGA